MATAVARATVDGAARTAARGSCHAHKWTGLTTAEGAGDEISIPTAADASVQVAGTFGGATITIQGSNEEPPVNWATLHDSFGADLTFTEAGIKAIAENARHIRPLSTGGTADAVDIVMLHRKTQ